VDRPFLLGRYRQVLADIGALLDLIDGERDRHHLVPGDRFLDDLGDQQHAAAGQPAAGVGHQIADRPVGIVEIEILDGPQLAVGGADGIAAKVVVFVKHDVLLLKPS